MMQTASEITEYQTNRALNVFAQHWMTLPFTVQDTIAEDHGRALNAARYAVWTCNARNTYAFSQSMRVAILELAAAIERHVTSAAAVVNAPQA